MDWLLYILVFVFGYFTCKTFYLLRSTRISLTLVKVAQLISLGVLARSTESFHYVGEYKVRHLEKSGFSDNKINAFKLQHELEIEEYKRRSINAIVYCHSSVFKDILEFNDWDSAMRFLEKNRELVDKFLMNTGVKDDR